ncbi:hypothetical protein RDWZM_006158 [Blomia tropicalis]|uniref:Calpain catalytic domain-containing protein n=1 Tax=Blomia tropicalis TaxID=40697 RepID=A0A9Q0RP31_BLOTA|nr:hypothetical protein RDWZM_006158 [Blomia tropicalis]
MNPKTETSSNSIQATPNLVVPNEVSNRPTSISSASLREETQSIKFEAYLWQPSNEFVNEFNANVLSEKVINRLVKLTKVPSQFNVTHNKKSKSVIKLDSLQNTIKRHQLKFCEKLKEYNEVPFDDDEFKPNRSSLYMSTDKPDPMFDALIDRWVRIAFVRFDNVPDLIGPAKSVGVNALEAQNYMEKLQSKVFVRGPENNVGDFIQGKLGNCWVICSLACLVWYHSHYLLNIIPSTTLNKEGIYQLFFCIDGRWTPIEIDDTFPVDKNRRLVFSQTLNNQMYAPLIEKAFAKHHSCYKALAQGTVLEGFSSLTGMPVSRIIINTISPNQLWKQLNNYLSKYNMLAASCSKGVMGLKEDHAYSVLDIMGSADVKALLLWNPWGKQDLFCRFNKANEWLKRKLPLFTMVPGMFWMRLIDFVQAFQYVDVCKFNTDWYCKRYQFQLPSNPRPKEQFTVFELQTDNEKTHFEFTIYQEVVRNVKLAAILELSVIIFKLNEDNIPRFLWLSDSIVTKVRSVSKKLRRGRYLIVVVSFNQFGNSSRLKEAPELAIAFHGSNSFKVIPSNCDLNLLGDMIISMAVKIGVPNKCVEQNWTEFVIRTKFCAFVTVVENDSDNHLIAWSDTRSSHNSSKIRTNNRTIDIIPPKTR